MASSVALSGIGIITVGGVDQEEEEIEVEIEIESRVVFGRVDCSIKYFTGA